MPLDIADPTAHDDNAATDQALSPRHPEVPVTLGELAVLKGEAIEIIQARVQIIVTLRLASIRATHPEDWLLFKSPPEQGAQVVGYLQDCGCDRVRDLWGIEVYDISAPEKVPGTEGGVFHYLVTGSGRCKLTKQIVEAMEGGRSSTDDFCKDKRGAELELAVRKAARANLDGNVTRELAGLKSVPLEELAAAWSGTNKRVEQCRQGRGFGTRSERLGARNEKAPDVDPPVCKVCGTTGVFRQGKEGRADFYGCPKYTDHPNRKWTINAAEWIAQQQQKTPPPPAAAAREPGAEG